MKKNKSNMYNFVSKTINPLAGECKHKCKYCYLKQLKSRFNALNEKYSGDVRIDEIVLKTSLNAGETYFVGSCNDIFADNVPYEMKKAIIDWCNNNPQRRNRRCRRSIYVRFLQNRRLSVACRP